MNRILWPLGIALVVVTVLGAGWMLHQAGPQGDGKLNEPLKEVYCLGLVDVEKGVAELYPEQPGLVVEIAETQIKDNDGKERERVFKKGEVLLRVKSELPQQQLEKAKAALAAAQADLDKANKLGEKRRLEMAAQSAAIRGANAEKARLDADLLQKRQQYKEATEGSLNALTLKAMEQAVKEAEAKIEAEQAKLDLIKLTDPELEVRRAKASVDAAQADLKTAEANLANYRIEAPFEGVMLRVNARVGEPIGPNIRAAAAIEFCPTAPRVVRAEVIQEWGHRVRVGQEATIQDDTYNGEEWHGRVKSLSDWYAPKRIRIIEPFMQNDVRTRECIIEFGGSKSPTQIGQRMRVKIKV
jgi:multidrug resistance efflux pump